MFKKFTFVLILVCCLLSFNAVITPPQPAQASIIGEPCSVHWVDKSQTGWPFVTNTWLTSCPISCPVDVAGDFNNPSDLWCADFTPPPNLPGVYLGNACTGSTSRTVTLLTDGTFGTNFEIEGNGQVVSGTSHTFTGIPEGLFTARGQAHNSKGSSGWSSPVSAQHDYSAPTTSTNLVGLMGDNNWYTSPVSISFSATDVGCLGVNQIAYTVNGGTQEAYTGTPFTVSNEGVNSLLYRATDGFNLENTQSATFGIDTQQPSLTILLSTPPNGAGWWNNPVAVAISATDATSGLASTLYDVNGTGLVPYTDGIILATDGIHTFDAQVSDNAGHVVYDGVVIPIDSIAPTLLPSVTGTQNGTNWFIAPATLTLTADDVTSGVAGMGYIVNSGSLNPYSSPVLFGTDGVYTIEAVAVDVALNMTSETLTISVDSTAPNLAIYLDGERGENDWFITPPTFILTANDATSGVGERVYAVENGGWNTYTAPVTITREGLYTIIAQVSDVATNSASHTFQIGYDITPPQTNAQLTETEDGMMITLNRWDGVSGYALTRMAINGVWSDYHHPVTVSEVGEYWVQFYTIDFAGNIEAEKIVSFTIAETGVVVTQVPPVVNIIPPANPPNTPPFETNDDFPPNLGDDNLYFVSPPPTTPPFETREDFPPDLHDEGVYFTYPEDNRVADTAYPPSPIIFAGGNANSGSSVVPMENRISRSPVIRESDMTTNTMPLFPLEGRFPTDRQPRISTLPFIRSESFEPNRMDAGYVDTTLAPQPTSNVVFVTDTTSAQGTSETPSSPLDVTMLAMLGLTMAGAGVMKSESARKKQEELAKADALAEITLAAALAEQKESAEENFAENQTMQANATQKVYTKVQQSQANIDFWASYAAWKIKAAEAEEKRRQAELEARIQAYYAALRLKPASPQPVQSMPVLGLLKGLLTGAKILGQGIKTVKSVVKAITEKNKATGVATGGSGFSSGVGAMGGGLGAGAIGGLAISPTWGDFGVSQSQEEDENATACTLSESAEFASVFASIIDMAHNGGNALTRTLISTAITLFPIVPAFTVDAQCGGENATKNSLFNTSLATIGLIYDVSTFAMFGASRTPIGPLILGFILIKELIMGLEPGKTPEEYASEIGIRPPENCPIDYEETAGDLITAFVASFYTNSGIASFDDERVGFGWMDENDQPITRILASPIFEDEVQSLIVRFSGINQIDQPALQSLHGLGPITDFETYFSNIMRYENLYTTADTLDEHPLLAHATLLHYLAKEDLLNDAIISSIRVRLQALGVEDPMNTFINPIINNTDAFQNASNCN